MEQRPGNDDNQRGDVDSLLSERLAGEAVARRESALPTVPQLQSVAERRDRGSNFRN